MGGLTASESEEVSPLSDVRCHDKLCLQTVGKDCPCFLRGTTGIQKVKISTLRLNASLFPSGIGFCTLSQITRLYDRNFVVVLILTVIAVPCGLLTVSSKPVSYDFMGYPTITDEFELLEGLPHALLK